MAVVTERLAVIIGGDAQGAVSAFHRTGKAAAGTDTVVARVTRNIERSFGGLGPAIVGAAAVVGPAGVIGAAVAGSGALFAGLGIAAVAGTDQVAGAFGALKTKVVADTKAMAAPIAPVLASIAAQTSSAFANLEPVIGNAFADVAPQIKTVADGLLGFANDVIPAFGRAVHDGAPVVNALSVGVDDLGHGLSGFVDGLTGGAQGAAQGLHALFAGVSDLLPPLGHLIGSLADAAGPILQDLDPAFHLAATVIGDTADVVDHLGGVLGVLSGPAVQAAVDVGAVVLAVKALKTAGSGVSALFGGVNAAVSKLDTAAGKLNAAGGKLASAPLRAGVAWSRLSTAVKGVAIGLPILGAGLGIIGASMAQRAAEAAHLRDVFGDLFSKLREGGQAGQTAAKTLAGLDKAIDAGKFGLFGDRFRDAFNDASSAAKAFRKNLSETDKAQQDVTRTQNDLALAIKRYGQNSPQAAAAAGQYNDALGRQSTLEHQVAQATETATRKLQDKINLELGAADSSVAYRQSQLDVDRAITGVKTAQDAYNTSLAQGGPQSAAAKQAATDLKQARLDEESATLRQVQAAGKLAVDSLPATATATDKAKASTDAQRRALDELTKKLAPGDPLRTRLDVYRRELGDIPATKHTQINASVGGVAAAASALDSVARTRVADIIARVIGPVAGAVGHRAGGGATPAGVPFIVGENRPEVFIPSTSGTILPTTAGMGGGNDLGELVSEMRGMVRALAGARFVMDRDGVTRLVLDGIAANAHR